MDTGPPASFSFKTTGYSGPISALRFSDIGLLFAGIEHSDLSHPLVGLGPNLLVYDIQTGALLQEKHIFQGIRIHNLKGTDLVNIPTNSPLVKEIKGVYFLLIWGQKSLQIFHIQQLEAGFNLVRVV